MATVDYRHILRKPLPLVKAKVIREILERSEISGLLGGMAATVGYQLTLHSGVKGVYVKLKRVI